MDFYEFVKQNEHCYAIEEGFALWKMTAGESDSNRFVLNDVHSMIIVMKGELKVRISDRQLLLTKNCFADIIGKRPWEMTAVSDDITAYQLFFTESFLTNLLKNRPPFPITYVLNRKKQPVSVLNTSTLDILTQRMEYIESAFQDRTHYFQSEMLKYSLWMLFLDISNVHLHEEKENNSKRMETERKDVLFKQFMKLLSCHIGEERTVNYYASKLCITPQYLNRVVKSISGRTVYEWISTLLLGEITQQLESADNSIQQIADILNFPDQATLTKFFKRHTGTTPTEYKRNRLYLS